MAKSRRKNKIKIHGNWGGWTMLMAIDFIIAFYQINSHICLCRTTNRKLDFYFFIQAYGMTTMTSSILPPPAMDFKRDAKAIVREVLNELSDDCTLEEIMLQLYVRASIIESRRQIAEGKGLSLAEARKDLDSWFTSRSLLNSSPN